MTDYYLGEIRLFSFNSDKIPTDFVPCDGRALQIMQYQALYAVLGVTYGGDGVNTFCVPDMRGRVPVHVGKSTTSTYTYAIGNKAGATSVSITLENTPTHNHTVSVSSAPATDLVPSPSRVQASAADGALIYCNASQTGTTQTFASGTVKPSSNSVPAPSAHSNLQPTFSLSYGICVQGLFPYHN